MRGNFRLKLQISPKLLDFIVMQMNWVNRERAIDIIYSLGARCPMYPAPMNGALVCMNREDGSQAFCQVACESGTDFAFHPPLLYVCDDSGRWFAYSPFPQSNLQVSWPDCASMFVAIIY